MGENDGQLYIVTSLKHVMMLLKCTFFKGFIFTLYDRHRWHNGDVSSDFKVEILLNNAFM